VREEDVGEFFAQQAERKRQKTESTSVPYFCKWNEFYARILETVWSLPQNIAPSTFTV